MPEKAAERSLHRKLAQIMYEAERIPKRGRAPAVMGGYPFVQVGDAADYIRKALGSALITMLPTKVTVVGQVDRPTKKEGGLMTTVDLVTEWTLTDGESGESITFESFGAGADGGDKYSGKASTSAMKYALLTAFLLSTGDDTELGSHEAASPANGFVPGPVTVGNVVVQPKPDLTPDGGLIGTAIAQGNQDFNLRETPDGWVLPFRVRNGSSSFIVHAEDDLARSLDLIKATVIDKRVQVWGHWTPETTPAKGTKPEVHYRILHLERIATPDGILPAPATDTPLLQPPDDVPLVGERPEAETAELFDDVVLA